MIAVFSGFHYKGALKYVNCKLLLLNLIFFLFLSLICSFPLLYSTNSVITTYTKTTPDCIMFIRVEPEH